MSYLEREIDSLKRAVEGERKKADDLIRERDLLNKLKTQAEHATHKQIDLIKINENTKRNLEQEMNGYRIEAQKQAKVGTLIKSCTCCDRVVPGHYITLLPAQLVSQDAHGISLVGFCIRVVSLLLQEVALLGNMQMTPTLTALPCPALSHMTCPL